MEKVQWTYNALKVFYEFHSLASGRPSRQEDCQISSILEEEEECSLSCLALCLFRWF